MRLPVNANSLQGFVALTSTIREEGINTKKGKTEKGEKGEGIKTRMEKTGKGNKTKKVKKRKKTNGEGKKT